MCMVCKGLSPKQKVQFLTELNSAQVGRNRQSFISSMSQLLSAVQLRELGRGRGGGKGFVVNYECANMVRNKAVRMAEIITL